jgi:hypothetical protein
VTQHGCLPSLLGDGDKGSEIVYGEEKHILFWHKEPNEPTKKGTLSFVLFESPFTSVSTVSRGHPLSFFSGKTDNQFRCLRSVKISDIVLTR